MRQAHEAYHRPLLAVAQRVLRDPHRAEEAVQEAFTRAWRACGSFDPDGGPLLPWLVAITRNTAIDMVRPRRRRPPATGRDHDAHRDPAEPSHEDRLLLRDELAAALRGLHEDHRTVIVETVIKGRPHHEVAAQLGNPSGTVRSRSHYGLRRLRAAIEASRRPVACPA